MNANDPRNTADSMISSDVEFNRHRLSSAPWTWDPLQKSERWATVLAILVVAVLTGPKLPPGICFADWGDFQLAARLWGIAHPPGYPGFTSAAYFATLPPMPDPLFGVTLLCWGSGLGALTLVVLVQIRLGVNAWLAGTIGIALTAYPRVWTGLLAPEVYMPSLVLALSIGYLLIRYAARGRRRDVLLASGLYGFAVANRTPLVLLFPFFAAGWLLTRARWEGNWRGSIRTVVLSALIALVPVIYTLGYLWIRDTPDTSYNYLIQYNAETRILPESSEGPRAQGRRVLWHVSGAQFADRLAERISDLTTKLRWVRDEVVPDPFATLVVVTIMISILGGLVYPRSRWLAWGALIPVFVVLGILAWNRATAEQDTVLPLVLELLPLEFLAKSAFAAASFWGLTVAWRRSPTAALVIAGWAISSVAYVCLYRIYGDAADLLPLLAAIGILIGLCLSRVFHRTISRRRAQAAGLLLTATIVVTWFHLPYRLEIGRIADARPFLKELDVATLPPESIICTSWSEAPPLNYARLINPVRKDLSVINAHEFEWPRLVGNRLDHPIYATYDPGPWGDRVWSRERNLFRLMPPRPTSSTDPSPRPGTVDHR